MLSATVASPISPRSWCRKRRPSAWARAGDRGSATSASRTRNSARPGSGASTPARILISVDLPDPFSPSSAVTEPPGNVSETSSSARVAPKLLETPLIDSMIPAAAVTLPCSKWSMSTTCVHASTLALSC